MKVEHLRIQGLRCLSDVRLDLAAGMTAFCGPNGAGKTSLLEALFVLSHGRSFRAGARDALSQRGSAGWNVFAQVQVGSQSARRLGLGREGSRWSARIDGESARLSELVGECAVVCFDPGSHALIGGGAEERRRFLDWGVFHVEHTFLTMWRRYQRALKQRNSLLRSVTRVEDLQFQPWELELDQAATAIDTWRQSYLAALTPVVQAYAARLLPELGTLEVSYRRGWTETLSLGQILASQRDRDASRGHTTAGPHRADWSISFQHAPLREHLSRGQEKLTALACLLGQAEVYAAGRGEWPIMCLDDLASELDLHHQRSLVEQLASCGAQVLITGTELPRSLEGRADTRVFHVEQGSVAPLL